MTLYGAIKRTCTDWFDFIKSWKSMAGTNPILMPFAIIAIIAVSIIAFPGQLYYNLFLTAKNGDEK